jgi:hypothetical protein
MVKLKNIVINGNAAKCNIYPEDSIKNSSLKVNLQTGEIISYTLPVGYEWYENHIAHANNYLVEVGKLNNEISTEKLIMWY